MKKKKLYKKLKLATDSARWKSRAARLMKDTVGNNGFVLMALGLSLSGFNIVWDAVAFSTAIIAASKLMTAGGAALLLRNLTRSGAEMVEKSAIDDVNHLLLTKDAGIETIKSFPRDDDEDESCLPPPGVR